VKGTHRATTDLSAFDVAEGFHLAHILLALDRTGVLSSLSRPAEVSKLASKHQVDKGILEAALQLLAARTTLLSQKAGRYRLTPSYDVYARFIIHQYLESYGENAAQLDRILRDPAVMATLVDRDQHTKAFEEAPAFGSALIADLIVQLALNRVLDVGCGTGGLLAELAARLPGFVGWGIDISPSMCSAARRRIAAMRSTKKIAVIKGDCRHPEQFVPASVIKEVRTITASSVANEFFSDEAAAASWLSGLKATFPNRIMLIADYYGRLGKTRPPWPRQTALHDFVQVISGQGVPPPTLSCWKKIYRAAECTLIHAVEDRNASHFVHVLRL
jgi:SAM-dependent methyltransferase